MSSEIVTLDVRDDLQRGREPFSRIMGTVAQLRPDEKLRLVAPFEPVPLFAVLAQQGFTHSARQIANGDWEVLFEREVGRASRLPSEPGASVKQSCVGSADADRRDASPTSIEVDARGLEPPQPLVKILEALAGLPAGAGLRARTDRRPMHLYAHLEERGFVGETSEQTDGSFLTHIRRG